MRFLSSRRQRQNIGFIIGLIPGIIALIVIVTPTFDTFHAPGDMNAGHGNLSCADCHWQAPGTVRQQLQANAYYLIGQRKHPANIVHQVVTNEVCLACHTRENDRHPVHRFLEPRFQEARQNIQPQHCISCHLEHTNRRVNIEPTFCVNCHQDTVIANDPIDLPHEVLFSDNRWETCLACHDFHGNHVMETTTLMANAYELDDLNDYLAGLAPAPYSDEKIEPALTQLPNRE